MKNELLNNGKTLAINLAKATLMAQKEKVFNPKNIKRMLTLLKRLQQSFRLMVGIPDYPTYLEHMKTHHPDLEPMDEKTFFRYCIEARYPSNGGKMNRCPC